jgi:hypothetical protein
MTPRLLSQPAVTLSSVKTVVEIAAIIVGGAWTYILFIKGRGRFPRAGLTHKIERRKISTGKVLMRLRVEITNDGPVVLNIRDATFRVQQVLPLTEELQETLSRTGDLVRPKELDVNWPLVAERTQGDAPTDVAGEAAADSRCFGIWATRSSNEPRRKALRSSCPSGALGDEGPHTSG